MLVARNIETSILLVHALVKNGLAALFAPGKDPFIDMLNRNTVIGHAKQRPEGLLYIFDSRDAILVDTSDDENAV